MKTSDLLISSWSPALLKMELDKWLWKESVHIGIKNLWEHLSTYPYLTRLKDVNTLLNTVKEGVRIKDYFGYSTGVDEKGTSLGVIYGSTVGNIYLDSNSLLVKPEVLEKQSRLKESVQFDESSIGVVKKGDDELLPEVATITKIRRFYGTVRLDPTRMSRDAGQIAEEIIQHLKGLIGSNIEITIEIRGEFSEDVPDDIVRTVSENCRTLKFTHFGFEEQ